jgi:S1-C subfamily serine protease
MLLRRTATSWSRALTAVADASRRQMPGWLLAAGAAALGGMAAAHAEDSVESADMSAAVARVLPSVVRIEHWLCPTERALREAELPRQHDPEIPRWFAEIAEAIAGGGLFQPTVPVVPIKVGSGSGVVMDAEQRLVLSNGHVVDTSNLRRNGAVMNGLATLRTKVVFSDGRVLEGEPVAADLMSDVGVLRVLDRRWVSMDPPVALKAAAFGRGRSLSPGEPIAAVGAALGGSITAVVGSASGRSYLADEMPPGEVQGGLAGTEFLHVAAPIVPGNSGGPIVNRRGEVVGLATMLVRSPVSDAFNKPMAITAEHALAVARALVKTGRAERPRLGVAVETIDEVDSTWRMDSVGADPRKHVAAAGLLVRGVSMGSPAAAAGVRPGDVIVKCNGHPVRSKGDVFGQLGPVALTPQVLRMQVLRWDKEGGEPTTVHLTLRVMATSD